jgi:hypothetical protein
MRPLSPKLMALHQIKNLLRSPDNWVQGASFDVRGPAYCLMGAILHSAREWPIQGQVIELFLAMTGARGIPRWNDAEDRTHAEVVDLIERAILAEEREWASAA